MTQFLPGLSPEICSKLYKKFSTFVFPKEDELFEKHIPKTLAENLRPFIDPNPKVKITDQLSYDEKVVFFSVMNELEENFAPGLKSQNVLILTH